MDRSGGQESLIRVAQVSAKPRREQRPGGSLEEGEGSKRLTVS